MSCMVSLTPVVKTHCKSRPVRDVYKRQDQLNLDIDPQAKVASLSIAYQQMIEIAKAVSNEVRVLIMDEPTTPLTVDEVNNLFELVNMLRRKGVTIIYISHRLEELFKIADRVTILRDGAYIGTKNIGDTTERELIGAMVGRPLEQQYPTRDVHLGKEILRVEKLNDDNKLKNISFSLFKGEVLGLAGLVGAGRTELLRSIFGANARKGSVVVNGHAIVPHSTTDAIANGLAFIPEDRKTQGLLLNKSVRDNISISSIKHFSKSIFLRTKSINEMVDSYIEKLKIKTPARTQLVRNLSGGNQQKVVIGKCLASQAKVYLFDEPTRGIDVGAKYEIYTLMNELVAHGNAIIMVSSDLPEILGMSDRIFVMHEGSFVGELRREEASQERIMEMASGTIV